MPSKPRVPFPPLRPGFGALGALFLGLGLTLGPTPLLAQSGILFVRVDGPDGPVANASVELVYDEVVLRRVGTDEGGAARMGGLPAGTFSVRVESLGFKSQTVEGVVIQAGVAQAVSVTLETAPVEVEGLTVTAERVQIQRQNTEFATVVREAEISLLPMTYNAADLVALTPGARPGFVWGGASFQANNYRVDGLSANHPGMGGDLLQPSIYWIDRVDVRGLGAGAEYGGFQGGLIDVVTKSGTNVLQGSIRTTFENDLLTGSNLVSTEIGTEVVNRQDVEGEIRGPIVWDRLFYFLSGKYVGQKQRALNHLPQLDQRYAPIFEERIEGKLFGKLTWTPGHSSKLELSGAYTDIRADNFGITGFEAEGASHRYSTPTWFLNGSARQEVGGWALLEARVNHFSRDERYDPFHGTEVPGLSTFSLTPPFTAYRNAPLILRSAPASTSATLLGNFRLSTGGWEHIIKVGAEYTRGSFLNQRLRNGGMTWQPVRWSGFDPEDPATWTQPATTSKRIASQWGGEVRLDADVANAAAFVQSSLSVGSRVALSPGIRWNQWKGWLTPTSGARFQAVEDTGWDPRVGINIDLTSDGTLVAKGHWGRYHQNLMTQMFDRAAGADVFTNQEYWYYQGEPFSDPATTFTEAERDALGQQGLFMKFGEEILNETGPVDNYRQPYIDQWLVGIEKQVGNWLKMEALYTRRSNKNMVALVDRNRATNYTLFDRVRVYDSSGKVAPFSGGSIYLKELYLPNYLLAERLLCLANASCPDALPIPGLTFADLPRLTWDPDFVLTTAPDAKREFNQIQLTLEVAVEEWGGSLSFVKTHLEGNLDNVSGYTDPSGYGAGPYVRVNEGVNSYGTLENFADVEWKASVWGPLPWNFRGGAFWTLRSGDHFSPRYRLYGLGFFTYRVNTGAMTQSGIPERQGDELDYKLMTPLEGHFVYLGPRGKPTLERQSVLDIRLERLFNVRGQDWSITLDVFNLFREEAIIRLNTIANNGPDYGFGGSQSMFAPPLEPNQYYLAPQERVSPQTIRLGLAVYF
ncbi:MAG: TonB-dependent receptor [Longimicrobiales bacterium]